jgi:hypothetical protein
VTHVQVEWWQSSNLQQHIGYILSALALSGKLCLGLSGRMYNIWIFETNLIKVCTQVFNKSFQNIFIFVNLYQL